MIWSDIHFIQFMQNFIRFCFQIQTHIRMRRNEKRSKTYVMRITIFSISRILKNSTQNESIRFNVIEIDGIKIQNISKETHRKQTRFCILHTRHNLITKFSLDPNTIDNDQMFCFRYFGFVCACYFLPWLIKLEGCRSTRNSSWNVLFFFVSNFIECPSSFNDHQHLHMHTLSGWCPVMRSVHINSVNSHTNTYIRKRC